MQRIYLVGGYIRDLLLGRTTYDMDFALDGDVRRFCDKLAKSLNAKSFVLDEKTQTFRITYKKKDCNSEIYPTTWNIDISKIQGKNIIADLKRRDFTIDAMAIDLGNFNLIDPFGGLNDLRKHLIRITSPYVLRDDPLRLLRAFRLAAILKFKIEDKTLKAISKRCSLIKNVSRERIRDELFKILSVDNSYKYIQEIERISLLSRIIPQVRKLKKELGLWKHSLLTLKFLEDILKNRAKRIWHRATVKKVITHLNKKISDENTKGTLLKFASLFHDIGKPLTKKVSNRRASFIGHDRIGTEILRKISESLRLSNKEIKIILKIARHHMRVHYLANLDFITDRALAHLIRDLNDEIITLCLFAVADFLATPARLKKQSLKKNLEVTEKILRQYFKFNKFKELPRLITGHDLIKIFHMKEGPPIGKVLEEIELLQREGKIKTRKEALQIVSKILRIRKK